MKELILEYLNETFYLNSIENTAYLTKDDTPIGFQQIESNITRTFNINEDLAHIIVFNWLLFNDIKLVRKNWNKTYITHNRGVYSTHETTLTEDIDFEYKLVDE
jgi:hypothetical protein